MSEYQVSDYGILSDAVTTTKNYITKVGDAKTAVAECKTSLGAGVFEGPIADNCQQELATLNTDVESIVSTFESISGLITQTSENYQAGDKDASSTVLDSTSKATDPTTANTIAEKKKAFVGNVDDPNSYDAVKSNFHTMRKTMTMFDNTTGEVLQDHATITLKPGETRVITVKLPTDTGMINEIHRTTADGGDTYRSGQYVTAKSDIDPDPNNVEYVNYKFGNHYPSDRSLLHSNTYDWIITAKADGTVKASQTCEYTTDASKNSKLKAMINLNVVVSSDDSTSS